MRMMLEFASIDVCSISLSVKNENYPEWDFLLQQGSWL